MKIVKIAKLTKIYGGNPKSGLERNLQLLYIHLLTYIQDYFCKSYAEVVKITQKKLILTTLKNAVAKIFGNSRKISISSSTVHETTTKTSPYVGIMYCSLGLT